MLLCAVMIRTAINLASNTAAFWMQSNRNAFPYLVHSLSDFARFPISIYSITMQLVVSVGIPYAFISFFPAAYVFEKTPWGVYGWLAPVIALYSMFIAYRLFQSGIKRYESTGN
jgi:ABC-2 type transport system permease protein